jgi:hypothetical protein
MKKTGFELTAFKTISLTIMGNSILDVIVLSELSWMIYLTYDAKSALTCLCSLTQCVE